MDGEQGKAAKPAFKEWTQFAIVLFATGWGVYTFVYKETIVPARRPATLAVTANLEEIGRTEESVLMRLRVHAVNRTDRKVYVPALWYSVYALRLAKQSGLPEEYRAQIQNAPEAEIQSRYSAIAEADLVAVGTFRNRVDDYYEPTDETTNEVLFELPVDRRYDALQVRSQYFLTKQIEDLALTGWDVSEDGELSPQLVLSGRSYDPKFNARHFAWAMAAGAGFYGSSSTLSLWPKHAPSATPSTSPYPREVAEQAARRVARP